MREFDDAHSPETCNYNECKADSDTPCPFVKDEPQIFNRVNDFGDCKHEWRQWFGWSIEQGMYIEDGFFCIFCKTRSE